MKKNQIFTLFFLILCTAILYAHIFEDRWNTRETQHIYEQLIPLVGLEETDDFDGRVDKIRQFLFEHTVYSAGEDFREIWGNPHAIVKKISAHATENSNQRAPMECSSRAGVMENILMALGYNVRSVSIYKFGKNFPSHVFTDVQNPETGQWQAQDSQYNIYWRSTMTGARLSSEEIIKAEFDEIEPCITPGQCGWDLPNRDGNFAKDLKPKMALVSINDYQRKRRPLFVNAKRFKLDEPQPLKDGTMKTFCQNKPKNCRDDIIIFE